jgi:hypothetical protein
MLGKRTQNRTILSQQYPKDLTTNKPKKLKQIEPDGIVHASL